MPPRKTKKGKPSGNIQESSAETISAGPNTQLQGSNERNTPPAISSTEDNIDIDTVERNTEIPTAEASTFMERQRDVSSPSNAQPTPTPTLSESSASVDIEKQIFLLEEKKRKLHVQLKLKILLEKEAEGFPLLAAPPAHEQTTNQRRTKLLAEAFAHASSTAATTAAASPSVLTFSTDSSKRTPGGKEGQGSSKPKASTQQHCHSSIGYYFPSEPPSFCTGELAPSPERGGKKIPESGTGSGGHPSVSLGILPSGAPVLLIVVNNARFWVPCSPFCLHIARVANHFQLLILCFRAWFRFFAWRFLYQLWIWIARYCLRSQ